MTAPQDPAATRRDRLRAGHADREQAIETLKDAFVHGRLTKGELDRRAGQALTARTRAALAALTSDIPSAPAAVSPATVLPATVLPAAVSPAAVPSVAVPPARPPDATRGRPLTRAASRSVVCLVIAAGAVRIAFLLDPGPNGPPGPPPAWDSPALFLLVAFAAVITAFGILAFGVIDATEQRRSRGHATVQRRSRGHLPPPAGPGGHAPDDGPQDGDESQDGTVGLPPPD